MLPCVAFRALTTDVPRRACISRIRVPERANAFRADLKSLGGFTAFYALSTHRISLDNQDHDLGLGANVPIATANLFDGVHAFVNGKFITLRVPYPLGFFSKGFEGRIDDPTAGWKGRGLWVPSGYRTPWHIEGGKGTKPLVVHFQMWLDPLAK